MTKTTTKAHTRRQTPKVRRTDNRTASKVRVIRESAESVRRRAAKRRPAAKLIAMLMHLHGHMVANQHAAIHVPCVGFNGTDYVRFDVNDVVSALKKAMRAGK